MATAKPIIDAIVADIDANAGLTGVHQVVRYRRPPIVLPDDCPLLCCWLDGKLPSPQTTELFDSGLTIGISIHEAAVEQVELLVADEALQATLIGNLEKIEARIRTWAKDGLGVAGGIAPWQILPGEVRYLDPILATGLVDGYALEVVARITEA